MTSRSTSSFNNKSLILCLVTEVYQSLCFITAFILELCPQYLISGPTTDEMHTLKYILSSLTECSTKYITAHFITIINFLLVHSYWWHIWKIKGKGTVMIEDTPPGCKPKSKNKEVMCPASISLLSLTLKCMQGNYHFDCNTKNAASYTGWK
jgi:hypothetical protein